MSWEWRKFISSGAADAALRMKKPTGKAAAKLAASHLKSGPSAAAGNAAAGAAGGVRASLARATVGRLGTMLHTTEPEILP